MKHVMTRIRISTVLNVGMYSMIMRNKGLDAIDVPYHRMNFPLRQRTRDAICTTIE